MVCVVCACVDVYVGMCVSVCVSVYVGVCVWYVYVCLHTGDKAQKKN